MLGRKKFEKIARERLEFLPPKPQFSKPKWLDAVKNTMRFQKAEIASVGHPKIAKLLSKGYSPQIAWELKELGEIRIPKELLPKQRQKFRKRKIKQTMLLYKQQIREVQNFMQNLLPKLYSTMFNPQAGAELAKQFSKEPAAKEIEQIIHGLARKSKFETMRIPQLENEKAINIPELGAAASKIAELVFWPRHNQQFEELKGRAAKQNTE